MKNLWQFIVNNSHLLLFLLLEAVAFGLITHYQSYSHATVLTSANRIVAGLNEGADRVSSYFRLREDNERLNEQIAQLQMEKQSLLNSLEQQQESSAITDTTYTYSHLGYRIIPAKVVDVSTHQNHNYLTLNKGIRDGITIGQGVMAGGSVVGVVSRVNDYFAQVVPIIHTSISISSRIQSCGEIGFTQWSGHDADHVNLMEIGRHVHLQEGDTVVTSGMTMTFPEGLLIGVVDKFRLSEGDNYYQIRLRLSTDFHRVHYVQVLDNTMKTQLDSLHHE